MTMNDAFDARLRATFASAMEPLSEPTEVDAFTHRLVNRLAHPDRRRIILLGGAGSTGSAIAGSQLEGLVSGLQLPTEGLLGQIALVASPEVLATALLAVAVGFVAVILPRRIA